MSKFYCCILLVLCKDGASVVWPFIVNVPCLPVFVKMGCPSFVMSENHQNNRRVTYFCDYQTMYF